MPQRTWSAKRERQYEHIKDSLLERGETPPPYAAGTGSTALHGADADTAMRQAMGLPIDN